MAVIRFPAVAAFAVLLIANTAYAQDGSTAGRAAEVNGTPILLTDVDAKLGNNIAKLQEQIFSLRQKQLDTMIDSKLLEDEAARRSVTIAALVKTEITSRVAPVSADEVTKFYEENKAKLQGDPDRLREQIGNFLLAQRVQAKQQEFLKTLRASAKIQVFLAPPPIFRSEVGTAGAPVRGASDAPVTIVEFSDFQCPFCRKVQPVLEQVRTKYAGRVKIVFRDFPIDSLHPQSRAASEAARCANEQGKFWEFHDKLFANAPDSSPATLDRYASEVGMDVTAFQSCRASGKYKVAIQAGNVEGTALGITGTPTFFINGRILVGALPFESFAKVIDEELAASAAHK